MRAKEFIGIAEFIKSRELSAKSKIEDLKGSLSKLSETKSSLERKVSSLYAELAAARNDVDEDGEPNYDWLAMIENQIDQANEELSDTEEEIQQDSAELEKSVGEYERIEEEKQQTLFEIQQKARSASQQMNAIGGMYVVYADIGASVNQALQESYDAFAQAAVILDGTVDSSSTGAGGRNSSGNLISNRGLSSGCVTAIAGASAILTSTPSSHAFKSAQISGTHTSRGTFHAFGERCEASKKGSRFSSSQRSSMENNAVVYRSANQDRNLSSGQESGTENMDRRSSLVSSGKTKESPEEHSCSQSRRFIV